jgi:hypothetical protein
MNEALIEAVTSAWREVGLGGRLVSSPAWHDLGDEERLEAFDRSVAHRRLEAATDPRGLSGTSHAVLARIRGTTR